MQRDLLHLVQNLDEDADDVFADARDDMAPLKRKGADDGQNDASWLKEGRRW